MILIYITNPNPKGANESYFEWMKSQLLDFSSEWNEVAKIQMTSCDNSKYIGEAFEFLKNEVQ